MADDSSNELARIAALEQTINELKAMVRALQDRLTTAEQSLSQRWWQS